MNLPTCLVMEMPKRMVDVLWKIEGVKNRMGDIKDYRERELLIFVAANVLLFLIIHNIIGTSMGDYLEVIKVLSGSFVAITFLVIAYGFVLVIECLFTSETKQKMIYLFGLFQIPGNTIFSDIKNKNKDIRLNNERLFRKYRNIYEGLPLDKTERKQYENEQWYQIYAKYSEKPMICASHRDALLIRDIYVSVLAMLGLYLMVCIFNFVDINFLYLTFLIVMSVITNFGANRKAKRFAYNVIAYDLNYQMEEDKV